MRAKTSTFALSTTTLLATLATAQAAEEQGQEASNGLFKDAHLNLLERNIAIYRNFLNQTGPRNYYNEWANGLSADYQSGFTQGTVGLGVDAQAYWGVKLDSGPGRVGTGLLPLDENGRARDQYGKVNGALKMRLGNTVLKYGQLQPSNPVVNTSDVRLFPQSYEGWQLLSRDIPHLAFESGRFTSANSRTSSDHNEPLGTGYSKVSADSATYVGGTYTFSNDLKASLFASNLEDVWNQYYLDLTYNLALGDGLALKSTFNLYRTLSTGSERSGSLNNTTFSLTESLARGPHTFTLAYQKVHGDEDYDHEGTPGQYGRMFIANSVQIYDFNGPHEQSWQARYDYNFAALGIPGLTWMVRYIKGFDIDGTHANRYYASRYGDDVRHWERDSDLRYVIQSGPAKNLSTTLRYAVHRSTTAAALSDMDEVRVIVQYPLSVF